MSVKKDIMKKANEAIWDALQEVRYHSYVADQEKQYSKYALAVRNANRIVDVADEVIQRIEDMEQQVENVVSAFNAITKGAEEDERRTDGRDSDSRD